MFTLFAGRDQTPLFALSPPQGEPGLLGPPGLIGPPGPLVRDFSIPVVTALEATLGIQGHRVGCGNGLALQCHVSNLLGPHHHNLY